MKRYVKVYRMLLILNVKALLVYPANFYNSVLATFAWAFFSLYSIVLLTASTSSAYGLTRGELLLVNGVYGTFIGVFHVIFSSNFGRFSQIIHNGQLDSVLTKPIDSQFLLSFWIFSWVSLSRVIISIGYVVFMVSVLHLNVSFLNAVLFLILGMSAVIMLYSIWYLVITLTIWFTRLSNLVELMFNITGMARYPKAMISGYAVMFLLPLLLLINVPTTALLYTLDFKDVGLFMFFTAMFFAGSRLFWRFALRYYTSASG